MTSAHFVGESQPERFASYFKQIGKTKEGASALMKQAITNKELNKMTPESRLKGKKVMVASTLDKFLKANGVNICG